jgi:hypothetical protein
MSATMFFFGIERVHSQIQFAVDVRVEDEDCLERSARRHVMTGQVVVENIGRCDGFDDEPIRRPLVAFDFFDLVVDAFDALIVQTHTSGLLHVNINRDPGLLRPWCFIHACRRLNLRQPWSFRGGELVTADARDPPEEIGRSKLLQVRYDTS